MSVVVYKAEELAATQPDGMLDPRLFLCLDEAGNCAAIKKPQLATTGRGQGIQLLTIWHDEAQLQHRYGHRASTVLNGHRAKLLLSGQADPASLELASKLVGDEAVTQTSETTGGRRPPPTPTRRHIGGCCRPRPCASSSPAGRCWCMGICRRCGSGCGPGSAPAASSPWRWPWTPPCRTRPWPSMTSPRSRRCGRPTRASGRLMRPVPYPSSPASNSAAGQPKPATGHCCVRPIGSG